MRIPLRPTLRADRRAVTTLETALVMIPFLILLMFVLGAGIQLFAAGALDAAVRNAARQIRIGTIRGNSDAALRTAVCSQLSGLGGSCANLQIYASSAVSFAALTPATLSGTTLSRTGFAPGAANAYVILQVAMTPPVLVPLPTNISSTFVSTVAFRNEP